MLRLKEYPPEASATTILSYLEQYALLRFLRVERIDVSRLSPKLILQRGVLDEICSHYSYLRRYFPTLFELPFQAEPGSRSLLEALTIVRRLDQGELRELPLSAPVDFVPSAWRKFLLRGDGLLDRRAWAIALGLALRDGLRSGDIYLPESRRHVSFWNLVYDERQWAQERHAAYEQLSILPESDTVKAKLSQEFDLVARQLDQGLSQNPFVTLPDGELNLKRLDALEVPERVHRLRQTIETRLPRIRIEDLLRDVDTSCGFTQTFRPLPGYDSRLQNHRGARDECFRCVHLVFWFLLFLNSQVAAISRREAFKMGLECAKRYLSTKITLPFGRMGACFFLRFRGEWHRLT